MCNYTSSACGFSDIVINSTSVEQKNEFCLEVQHGWIFQSRAQLICTKNLFVRLDQRAKVSACPSPRRTIFGHARLGIKDKIKSPNRYSAKSNSIRTKSTKTKHTKVKRTKALHKA